MENKDINVILLGNVSDSEISKAIKKQLTARVICCNGTTVGDYENGKQNIYLLESERLENHIGKNSIVVLKKSAKCFENISSAEVVLLCSEDKYHLKALADNCLCAVTCGMSHKDTVTYSSKGEDKSIVSLQREIIFKGYDIEPQEIAVSLEIRDNYTAFVVATLSIMCKFFDSNFQ